jgi:hypothetical protein
MGAEQPAPARREEMDDAAPFSSWRAIYLVVLGALAAEIAAGIAITLVYR